VKQARAKVKESPAPQGRFFAEEPKNRQGSERFDDGTAHTKE